MPSASFILPFAVLDKNRKEKFDENMELAAILCLAEAKRRKHGMIRLPEEIRFVSKLHYPFWAVPWENRCLLIDGLQLISSSLTYTSLPNLESFLNDIERGRTNRPQFHNALNKCTQTFLEERETVSIATTAVITNGTLLSDLSNYVEETSATKTDVKGNIALVTPKLDQDAANEKAKAVLDLYERLQYDIKGLGYASQVLNQVSFFHQQKILHEIELVNEALKKEIDGIKPTVDRKIEQLLKERDNEVQKMNKATETQASVGLREKEKHQRKLQRLELQRIEYRRRLDLRRDRRDRVGETRWEHNLRTCENKISEVKERIESLSRYIERNQRQHFEDIERLKLSYQAWIDSERKKISDIQASFQSIINAKEDEKEKLKTFTAHVVGLIEQLAEQEKLHTAEIKSLTVSWQPEQASLLGVPFYLVAYETEDGLRYNVFPPFRVMSAGGIVKKIKKALLSFRLASRIQLLLQLRSKILGVMLSTNLEKVKTEKTLKENMRRLGEGNNFLSNESFKEALTQGLKELKAEGWIKQEEGNLLMKRYLGS